MLSHSKGSSELLWLLIFVFLFFFACQKPDWGTEQDETEQPPPTFWQHWYMGRQFQTSSFFTSCHSGIYSYAAQIWLLPYLVVFFCCCCFEHKRRKTPIPDTHKLYRLSVSLVISQLFLLQAPSLAWPSIKFIKF